MGKLTISMAIFHSYVKLPEGIGTIGTTNCWSGHGTMDGPPRYVFECNFIQEILLFFFYTETMRWIYNHPIRWVYGIHLYSSLHPSNRTDCFNEGDPSPNLPLDGCEQCKASMVFALASHMVFRFRDSTQEVKHPLILPQWVSHGETAQVYAVCSEIVLSMFGKQWKGHRIWWFIMVYQFPHEFPMI